ncbi:MAG: hypothetical protein ABSC23_14540 [Bryobacteraceae bacterium]|jgi:hypothetical protein
MVVLLPPAYAKTKSRARFLSTPRQEARFAFLSAAVWPGWTWAECAAITAHIGSFANARFLLWPRSPGWID